MESNPGVGFSVCACVCVCVPVSDTQSARATESPWSESPDSGRGSQTDRSREGHIVKDRQVGRAEVQSHREPVDC